MKTYPQAIYKLYNLGPFVILVAMIEYIAVVFAFITGYLLGVSKIKDSAAAIVADKMEVMKSRLEDKHIKLIVKRSPISLEEKTINALDNER